MDVVGIEESVGGIGIEERWRGSDRYSAVENDRTANVCGASGECGSGRSTPTAESSTAETWWCIVTVRSALQLD